MAIEMLGTYALNLCMRVRLSQITVIFGSHNRQSEEREALEHLQRGPIYLIDTNGPFCVGFRLKKSVMIRPVWPARSGVMHFI
jgi:hypothetical protein